MKFKFNKILYLLISFFLFLSISLLPSHSSAKGTAEKYYKIARSDYYSLKGSKKKQIAKLNWTKCIKKFLLVYQQFPKSPLADDALFSAGRLYFDVYKRFGNKKDLDFAVHFYNMVAKNYSSSRLADDAMFRVGEIRYYDLKDFAKAQNIYASILKKFPKGDMVGLALKRLKQLKSYKANTKREKANVVRQPKKI